MAGLLGQGWEDPRSAAIMSLAGGLLKGDFGGGLLGANEAVMQSKQDAVRQQYMDMQMRNLQAQEEQRRMQIEAERRKREALPGLFRAPGMTGGQAVPQEMGGIPMFSQPMGVSPMQGTPGGLDVMAALQAGYDPKEIQELAGLSNVGRPKATRQIEVDDGRGGKRIALVDDFGNEVAGFSGYTAPVQVNQGGQVSFVRPSPGLSLPVTMSPSERDASARGWAGINLQREQAAAGKAPQGYRFKQDGSLEAIPGGPADLRVNQDGVKKVSDAKDVLNILNEVEQILPKATGSWAGAGTDLVASTIGGTTQGAMATAQLKALQGLLVSKMPKMSGPQSDKDVLLYREMAGQVGDPTIPIPVRQAAVETIRKINEKYAGVPEGSSKPPLAPAPQQPAAPKPILRWDPHARKLVPVN
jgi:hypothetical protein